jgi:hypothetical protein
LLRQNVLRVAQRAAPERQATAPDAAVELVAELRQTGDPVVELRPPRGRERIGRADAVVLITPEYNHGYPAVLKEVIDSVRVGKLDEFLAAQIAEQGRLAGHVRGVRGARLHRSIDGKSAVGMAVFESARAHQEWLATARFADHLAVIAPLLERADPKLYSVAFEAGTL